MGSRLAHGWSRAALPVVAVAALALTPGPAGAQATDAELAAAAEAQARGSEMFAYDQAAWHATDRFKADLAALGKAVRDPGLTLRGYVVEPDVGGVLLVSFYGGTPEMRAVARYRVDSRRQVEGGMLAEGADTALSPMALRLIAARDVAAAQVRQPGHEACVKAPFNTLVLPPRADGVVPVYLLTAAEALGVYPAGGHYRFDVDGNGKLVGERRFMTGCFPIDTRSGTGKRAAAMVLSHVLDPQPTEVHAFVSRNIPIGLIVATVSNHRLWTVTNGDVRFNRDLAAKK